MKVLVELLEKDLAPLLWPFLEKIAIALLVAFEKCVLLAARLEELIVGFFVDVLLPMAIRLVANSKTGQETFEIFVRRLFEAVARDYLLVLRVFEISVLTLVVAVGVPLLVRNLARKNLRVFVSFNAKRERDAESVEGSLAARGMRAIRIPYRVEASHQEIVGAVPDGVRQAHLLLCLPGIDASFVDNEVMAATATRKAVVFLLSEVDGTLPNSADKRYPIFKLEGSRTLEFQPLIEFLRYIGADYTSLLEMTRRSVHEALEFFGKPRGGWTLLAAAAASSLYAYLGVYRSGATVLARSGLEMVREGVAIVLASAILFLVLSIVALIVVEFVFLVLFGMRRQLRTQRKAALEIAGANFSRDDWLGLVPGLQLGSPMYECLFEGPALAHHERKAVVK